jgi:hypothetical protein
LRGECLFQTGHQLLHRQFDFRILQSTLSILHNYPESKTFLVFGNALSGVKIEQLDVLNECRQPVLQAIPKGLQRKIRSTTMARSRITGGNFETSA